MLGKLLLPTLQETGSIDGKYQTVAKSADYLNVSHDYGVTWIQKESARNWQAIAVSDTGQYQVAVVNSGYIYVSSDYGNTWTERGTSQDYYGVEVSGSGQFMVASSFYYNNLYKSNDYGVTWSLLVSSKGSMFSMSRDGQYIVAHGIYASSINRSTDYGVTWSSIAMPGAYELRGKPSVSKDGQHQIVVGLETYTVRTTTYRRSRVWYSSNYGASWSLITTQTFGSRTASYFTFSDINDAGNLWVISYDYTGTTYITQDYGATWATIGITTENHAVSGTGQHITAGTTTDVSSSDDSGDTWSVAISGLTYSRALAINKST